MADEFESIELEVAEEDILYYIVDDEDNEIGFAILENGEEVEYYYDGSDGSEYESADAVVENAEVQEQKPAGETLAEEEVIELEVSEEDILYYIADEDDNEIGFAILENGEEVGYYYDGSSADDFQVVEVAASAPAASADAKDKKPASKTPEKAEEPKERGYLSKMASIAGFHGNKARKKAEVELGKVRGVAEKQVDKAAVAVEEGSKKLKAKKEETDLGITREDIAETTADLNVLAKEGAETAKELKAAYDDIMDSFGVFVPKKIRRRLP